jgi:hypothetical protein
LRKISLGVHSWRNWLYPLILVATVSIHYEVMQMRWLNLAALIGIARPAAGQTAENIVASPSLLMGCRALAMSQKTSVSVGRSWLALALLFLSACSGSVKLGPQAVAGLTPDGTIDMQEVQVAYLASGGGGSGTLFYQGGAYPFSIGGLGVGGIGASTISATGEVYKLPSLTQFPGTYVQGRYGFALGDLSGGDLWLQNDAGVILHLKAKREGLMLSLGGDAIVITLQ